MKIKLYCPECGSGDNITVKPALDIFIKNQYPFLLNCRNCGQFEIDKTRIIKPLEDHAENCQCSGHKA